MNRPPFLPATPLLASLALLTLTAAPAFSAIIVTLPTATETGSIVITQDINFTITAAGSFNSVILDEWVTDDGTLNRFQASAVSPDISSSLNGGPLTSKAFHSASAPVDNGYINNSVLHFPTPS